MNRRDGLDRLHALSQLILDLQLAEVTRAAHARQESLARLGDLSRPATAQDLPLAVQHSISVAYEGWADQRRADINLALARQTADWLQARDAAAAAFGRAQVLNKLCKG